MYLCFTESQVFLTSELSWCTFLPEEDAPELCFLVVGLAPLVVLLKEPF